LIREMERYRYWAEPRLREAYTEAERAGNVRRQLNASLALLPGDSSQVDYLYTRFLDASPEEGAVILQCLADTGHLIAHQGRGLALLDETLKRSLGAEATEEDKETLAKRQANAAVVLLRLGRHGEVWPLLKHSSDPRVRSY